MLNHYYNKGLKGLARRLRKDQTKAEAKIWQDLLRNRQCMGYKFLRQRPIKNYIVDFFCKGLNLIIEIDGYSHHFEEISANDKSRETELTSLGYEVIRFTDHEVLSDLKNVLRTLENFIFDFKESLPLEGDSGGDKTYTV